jgi:hypothetical protein
VGFAGGLVDLGEHCLKDCAAPVHIWGWNPAITRLIKPGGALG